MTVGILSSVSSWLGLTPPPPLGGVPGTSGVASPWSDASHLEHIVWTELWPTELDAPISRHRAMAIPAVARGRHVICGQVGRVQLVPSDPSITWAAAPEPYRAPSLTWGWTTDAMLFHGRAWWHVTDRSADWPASFEVVAESRLASSPDGSPILDGQPIPARDLIRIDAPHEGLLTYARPQLRAALDLYASAGRAAANPVPSVDLHQTQGDELTTDQKRDLVDAWVRARRGASGGVAYSNQAIDVRPLGQPAEQLLIAARKQIPVEVAQLMGLPAWAVDAEIGGTSITYSNAPSRLRELLDVTLSPYLDAIAGRLSLPDIVPTGQAVRFATNELTSPDFSDRMVGYQAAIDAGIYTVEECQAMERDDYPTLTTGRTHP